MPAPILYCGDTSLATAASYLAGLMHRAGLSFDYRASHEPVGAADFGGRRLLILSDYPAAKVDAAASAALLAALDAGCGLLVLGGWETYHGLGGDWDQHPLAARLPVAISPTDDRVNGDGAALLRTTADGASHPLLAGLPFAERPPVIGGWNRFAAKPGAKTLLEVVPHTARRSGDGFTFAAQAPEPLLVVDERGPGRSACLATDAAPHWVGPLVDWGTDNARPSGAGRVPARADGAEGVEVGALYAELFTRLVRWTAKLQ